KIDRGVEHRDGIVEAGGQAQKVLGLKGSLSGNTKDIPRSHLTWWSRVWGGTSGERGMDAQGKHRGGFRALVAPTWVVQQRVRMSPSVRKSIESIEESLESMGLRTGKERVSDFLSRKGYTGKIPAAQEIQTQMLRQSIPTPPPARNSGGGAVMCNQVYRAG